MVDAVPIFEGPMLALPDTRQDYGEDRIISLRKANRHERKLFEEAVQNELEEG